MTILVTGATGAIGPTVVKMLHQAGHRLRTISLEKPSKGLFPPDLETMVGDITDDVTMCAAVQGVEAVVHMAALLHTVNPSPEMREMYENVNVRGTSTVVDAAVKEGVRRIIMLSTIAVYGPSNGCVLDETSPTRPDTMYAQTKLAAERFVLDARAADGQTIGTVLRLGAVYGSRIKGNYQRLMQALMRGHFIPVGNGLSRKTLVYDKDVARAVLLAVSHSIVAGRVYNVTDGTYHTLQEIIKTMCLALECRQPTFSLPIVPIRLFLGFIEHVSFRLGRKIPATKAMFDKYVEDIAVDGGRIQRELGFMPQYNLQAGWVDAIREMRK